MARQNLRSVIIRVLMDTLNGDKTKEGQIQQQIQVSIFVLCENVFVLLLLLIISMIYLFYS